MFKRFMTGAAISALSLGLVATEAVAQQTTGVIRGLLTDEAGGPAAGVTVRITHVPTGTVSQTTTNSEGAFSESGLRPGGPYSVELSGEGLEKATYNGIMVGLADPYQLVVSVVPASDAADIVVTASRATGGRTLATGASSRYGEGDVANTVSISRDLKDVFRKDPLVTIDPTNSNAFSFAGSNTRFNSINVDGIRQNDDFGLNNNGYPSQRSPISLDAIQTVEARVAPYGVVNDGFFGGNVNVVTKSGTNEFEGSLFYEFTDDTMRGKRVQLPGQTPRDLAFNFQEDTWGATLGGPIIPDTLFFFLNYEKFEGGNPIDTGPFDGGFANRVPGISTAMIDRFRSDTRAAYNFDPLGVPQAVDLADEKMLAKIDWNINNDHRAVFSYQRTEGNSFNGGGNAQGNSTSATTPQVGLLSRQYDRGELLTQYRLELISDWSDNFSTELRVGVKKTQTDQIPLAGLGVGQAEVNVFTLGSSLGVATPAGARINFGPDTFRHDNYLEIDTQTADLRGTYEIGRHTILAGVGAESYDFLNVFVPNSLGTYTYSSYASYLARTPTGYSLSGALTPAQVAAGVAVPATFATARNGAAEFSQMLYNAYLQDSWDVTDDLTVQYGVRYVRYAQDDQPLNNVAFQSRQGFSNQQNLDGLSAWLPRLGFNWDVADNINLRGGFGRFTGGSLNVWVSNNFSVNGVNVVNAVCPAGPIAAITSLATVPAGCTLTPGNGNVNVIDPNFEIPTVWKANFGGELFLLEDQSLRLFGDIVLQRTDEAVTWVDLRARRTGTAPDGRPIYSRSTTGTVGANGFDMMLTNTKKGKQDIFVIGGEKEWDNGLRANLSYTYTNSKDAHPATSSIALSNYENVAASDHNNLSLAVSDYEIRDSVKGLLEWTGNLFGDNETVVSLYGERRSGLPFSYTFNGTNPTSNNSFGWRTDAVFGNVNDGISGGRSSNQLFYVPSAADIGTRVLLSGISTADFDAMLARTGLDKWRGQIAPRNAFNSRDVAKFDLRLSQELPAFVPNGAKVKVYMDIENLGNLMNDEWGIVEQPAFPRLVPVLNTTINGAGQYVYSVPSGQTIGTVGNATNLNANQSTYQIKLGIRYQF
jgi:outer membrane receptor protein involved in Fe transport